MNQNKCFFKTLSDRIVIVNMVDSYYMSLKYSKLEHVII